MPERARAVVLVDRAVIDGERGALVGVTGAEAERRDGERAGVGVVDERLRVEVAAQVERHVALGEVVLGELVFRVQGQALAADVVADHRLCLVVGELRAGGERAEVQVGEEVDAAVLQRARIEATGGPEREEGERRDRRADHVVRERLVEPGTQADVGGVGRRVGVGAGDLGGLAGDDVGVTAALEVDGELGAVVRPQAGLEAVVAGKLVPVEQVGGVEDEALRIDVDQRSRADLVVGPGDDLADRLQEE